MVVLGIASLGGLAAAWFLPAHIEVARSDR
jgi:hypothetical protein